MIIFSILSDKYGEFEILIDDEDSWILNYTWHIRYDKNSNSFRVAGSNGVVSHKLLSRIIMNVNDINIEVDHWNHNTLDNRKNNLRLCNRSENMHNIKKFNITKGSKIPTSKYKGVSISFSKKGKYSYTYWRASIMNLGRRIEKRFPYTEIGEIEAAKWYDKKAVELFGEFALVNGV